MTELCAARRWRAGLMLTLVLAAPVGAHAYSGALAASSGLANPDDQSGSGFTSGIAKRSNLLGAIGGLRTTLGRYGISLGLTEIGDVLGNISGGVSHGAAYDGLTEVNLQIDSRRAFGYAGGAINISALQYHGRNFSADSLLNLQTSSGIEADRATRLWELWYQQKFLDGRFDAKIGQQSVDQEFIVSSDALLFVNTMFGWPLVPSYDLPGGGPAYPLSALGVRLRAQPTPAVTVLAGMFNGSPTARFNAGDPQRRNAAGISFPLNGDALLMGEVQYAFPANGQLISSAHTPLAGTYKLGFWVDTENFADQRFDTTGRSLADPGSNGTPVTHRNDYSVYGVMDQAIWASHTSGPRTLNVFSRVMAAPGDRNLVGFSLNAGLVLHDPLPRRDDDTAGIAIGYGKIGANARALDRDRQVFAGPPAFARGDETMIEATYQFVPAPWLQLQPDFQYVCNPGAGIANPVDPSHKVRNEAIFGLRTDIVF